MTTDAPLIWTTRGNLPVADLTYATRWEDTADYIKFIETYTAADGVVVRESAHVLGKRGMFAESIAAPIA